MSESSFTFRINKNSIEQLQKTAKNNNRIASQLVRDFMLSYIDEKGVKWANIILTDFDDKSLEGISSKFGIKVEFSLVNNFKIKAKKNNHVPSKIIRAAIQQYIMQNTKA
ncbi:MAG: hypothetical protein J6N72_05430 [Psychrobacter sp.]|nr:hypothetical protein [Psychrobacter sp.]